MKTLTANSLLQISWIKVTLYKATQLTETRRPTSEYRYDPVYLNNRHVVQVIGPGKFLFLHRMIKKTFPCRNSRPRNLSKPLIHHDLIPHATLNGRLSRFLYDGPIDSHICFQMKGGFDAQNPDTISTQGHSRKIHQNILLHSFTQDPPRLATLIRPLETGLEDFEEILMEPLANSNMASRTRLDF